MPRRLSGTASSRGRAGLEQGGKPAALREAGTTPNVRDSPVPRRRSGRVKAPPSPGSEDARHRRGASLIAMDEVERLLRRLAINDEESVGMVLSNGAELVGGPVLRPKVDLLVRLGALLALGAATSSLRTTVRHALDAGATESEIVGVLVAVAPAVGLARVVSSAPRLAVAIGYDIEVDE
jgi:alkylhydroperoxidase/carboxymuconolactone decarboxylase family protein YurZ